MQITDWIQVIGIMLAIIGLMITMINNRKQLKMFNNQLKLNFFYSFSKKAFRDTWNKIELDRYYYPDFTKWMKDAILKNDKKVSVNQ